MKGTLHGCPQRSFAKVAMLDERQHCMKWWDKILQMLRKFGRLVLDHCYAFLKEKVQEAEPFVLAMSLQAAEEVPQIITGKLITEEDQLGLQVVCEHVR